MTTPRRESFARLVASAILMALARRVLNVGWWLFARANRLAAPVAIAGEDLDAGALVILKDDGKASRASRPR